MAGRVDARREGRRERVSVWNVVAFTTIGDSSIANEVQLEGSQAFSRNPRGERMNL